MSNEFVIFEVLGTRFRVQKRVFDNYPNSLLYGLVHLDKLHIEQLPKNILKVNNDEFFVQRSPDVFKIVLLYCINGKLHVPTCLCSDEIAEEFDFWRIKYESFCSHCATHHCHEQSNDEEEKIERKEKGQPCPEVINSLWTLLEYPHSSRLAFVFNVFSMIVIFVSILNIIISSVPALQFCPNGINGTNKDNVKSALDSNDFQATNCTGTFVFNIIDMICVSWFSIELILRFISCPVYKNFFKSPFIIIDILSILPFYFELIVWLIDENDQITRTSALLAFFRMFKLLRIFRVLKLARYSLSLKVLGKTISSAKGDLWMLLLFVVMALLIFSNCLYQIERDQLETQFTSVPAAIWWCIVTLSTVGYGDMYPQTVLGKCIAGVACVCGVLLFSFPVAILVEKFTTAYNEQRKKDKEKHRQARLFNFHLPHHHHHHKEPKVYKL